MFMEAGTDQKCYSECTMFGSSHCANSAYLFLEPSPQDLISSIEIFYKVLMGSFGNFSSILIKQVINSYPAVNCIMSGSSGVKTVIM